MADLIYFGISLPNQRSNPLAHKIRYCTPEELSSAKVGHAEHLDFLEHIKNNAYVQEAVLISTCNRFEIMCFTNQTDELNLVISSIAYSIKSYLVSEINFGILVNDEARYQFLRTFCGLNSGLVGESEISTQIRAGFRLALNHNFLAKNGQELLQLGMSLREQFNKSIYQSEFSYCDIAISKALMSFMLMAPIKSITVLGSGNTAVQSCLALTKQGFTAKDITVIHRVSSSSIQMQAFNDYEELRGITLIRSKRHGYKTEKVERICNHSDLVIFGIDSKLPVVEFKSGSNVAIIDFNSNLSCTIDNSSNKNYIPLAKLDALVREFSVRQSNNFELTQRIISSEKWLVEKFLRQEFLRTEFANSFAYA